MNCPRCPNKKLSRRDISKGVIWFCDECGGRTVGLGLLRKITPSTFLTEVWQSAQQNKNGGASCPACQNPMSLVSTPMNFDIDVCVRCFLIWFDKDELPPKITSPVGARPQNASPEANQLMAQAILQAQADRAKWDHWQNIGQFLNMRVPWYKKMFFFFGRW